MCELTLLVHIMDTESTPPPICGCVLAVVRTGERALLRFNTHTHTSSYYAHHVAAISAAVTRADAVVILNAAATMSFKLSIGMPALS